VGQRTGLAGSSACDHVAQILGRSGTGVLALARTVIEARLAQRQGDKAAAIERFERARELQDGLPTS
jgi:hypothetical protein